MDHLKKEQQHNRQQEDKEKSSSSHEGIKPFSSPNAIAFTDNRPSAIIQRKQQEIINNSPQVQKALQLKEMINNSPQVKKAAQLQEYINNSPRMMAEKERQQNVFGDKLNYSKEKGYTVTPPDNGTVLQKQGEEEELQMKTTTDPEPTVSWTESQSKKSMPRPVQMKMEKAFNTNFSNVNISESSKATELGALAYTQGNNIHFAPGQYNPESQQGQELLGHELTHVVQQREGKVQPTTQFKGVRINDDKGLEKEADEMGKKVIEGNDNGNSNENSRDDYRTRIINSVEYKNFKEKPGSPLGKWEQFHSQGDMLNIADITVHIAKGNNNTYTSLALKYDTTVTKLKLLNAELVKKYGNVIPAGTQVKLWGNNQFEGLENFTSEDVIFEFAAHHLVYKPAYTPLNENELKILGAAGYSSNKRNQIWYTGPIGFQALLIKSATSGKPDMVAFRGTHAGKQASDMLTIYADTDPMAVGSKQFILNQKKIEEQVLGATDGKMDVTGHSLGGAVAQHIAAHYPGNVRKVITFQSPGIDKASVDKFTEIPEQERPEAVHHIVKGDLVDKSGDGSLPGMVIEHDFGIKQDDTRVIKQKCLGHFKNLQSDYNVIDQHISIICEEFKGIYSYDEWTDFVPVYDHYQDFNHLRKIYDYLGGLNYSGSVFLKDAQALLKYLGFVGAGIGEAHTKFISSSSDHAEERSKIRMTDQFLLTPTDEELKRKNKPGTGGVGLSKENIEQDSRSKLNYIYPNPEQRKTGEEVRDLIGEFINKYFTTAEVETMTKAIEKILRLIDEFKKAFEERKYRTAYSFGKKLIEEGNLFYNTYKLKFQNIFKN